MHHVFIHLNTYTGTGRILRGWLACTQSVTYSLKQSLSPFSTAEWGREHPPWWSDGILVTFTHLYHCRIWLGIQKKAEAQQKFRRCCNTNQFLATHGLFNGICEKCDTARWIHIVTISLSNKALYSPQVLISIDIVIVYLSVKNPLHFCHADGHPRWPWSEQLWLVTPAVLSCGRSWLEFTRAMCFTHPPSLRTSLPLSLCPSLSASFFTSSFFLLSVKLFITAIQSKGNAWRSMWHSECKPAIHEEFYPSQYKYKTKQCTPFQISFQKM